MANSIKVSKPFEIIVKDYYFDVSALAPNTTKTLIINRSLIGDKYVIVSITPLFIDPATWALITIKSISETQVEIVIRNLNTTNNIDIQGGRIRICYSDINSYKGGVSQ